MSPFFPVSNFHLVLCRHSFNNPASHRRPLTHLQQKFRRLSHLSTFSQYNSSFSQLGSRPSTPVTMCVGQAFSFEACGHSQSIYSTICAQSSNNKTNTSCDRLEYMGVKPGLCSSCQSQDAHIENLRKELKAKESELNEALMARGDKLLAYSALVEQPRMFH